MHFNETCHKYSSCECEEPERFQGQRPKDNVAGTPFMRTLWMWYIYLLKEFWWRLPQIFIMSNKRTKVVVRVKDQGHWHSVFKKLLTWYLFSELREFNEASVSISTNVWMLYGGRGRIHLDGAASRQTDLLICNKLLSQTINRNTGLKYYRKTVRS